MRTRVIDLANVAMAEVEIDANIEKGGKFGIDVDSVASKIDKFDTPIEISMKKGEKVMFKSGRMTYTTAAIREDMFRELKDVNLQFDTKIVLLGSEFKDIISMAKDIDERVVFKGGEIVVDDGMEQLKLSVDDVQGSDSKAAYSIAYLDMVARNVEKTDTVEIEYSSEKPCCITVIGDGITMKTIIAPRID